MMRFGFLFAANYGNLMTQLNLTLFEIRVQLLTGGGAREFSRHLQIWAGMERLEYVVVYWILITEM